MVQTVKFIITFLVLIICVTTTANAQESRGRNLFGTWQIVAFRFGEGISVGPREARKFMRLKLRLGETRAQSGREVCTSPVYKSKRMTADEFSYDFRTSLKSIGIRGNHVDVVDIECGGRDWLVPGGTLLKVKEDQMLTLWDGVFFVLKKQRKTNHG